MTHPERTAQAPVNVCPECGRGPVGTQWEEETFDYGGREKPIQVTAQIPVRVCSACRFEFEDDASEWARHAAACRHCGVMTPEEVRGVRDRYGLSQQQFADLTGLGVATLGRWERGHVIQ